eukprot:Nk52_evm23s218 gene=Nk52_evmTU23s218
MRVFILVFLVGFAVYCDAQGCDSLNFPAKFDSNAEQVKVLQPCFSGVKAIYKKIYTQKFFYSPYPNGYNITKSREGQMFFVQPGDVVIEDDEGYQWSNTKDKFHKLYKVIEEPKGKEGKDHKGIAKTVPRPGDGVRFIKLKRDTPLRKVWAYKGTHSLDFDVSVDYVTQYDAMDYAVMKHGELDKTYIVPPGYFSVVH